MVNPDSIFDKDKTMAIPCGLSARSTFDDSFVLFRCEISQNFTCNKTPENIIPIHRSNIAWDTDMKDRYKNIDV